MTFLARYLIKNNIMLLFLLCLIISTLYCIFNFIDNKSSMTLAPSLWIILKYYLLSIPYIVNLLFGLLFFLSVVIQCTIMVRQKEILALLSSGISLRQIMTIFFYYSLFLVVFSFIMTESGILAERAAREVYRHEIRQRPKLPQAFTNLWFTKNNMIIHLGTLISSTKELNEITIYMYTDDMKTIQKQLSSNHGILENNTITLNDVKQIDFQNSIITMLPFIEIPLAIDVHAIEVANTKLTELTFLDIIQAIHILENVGFDTTILHSGIHSSITNALSIVIMGILALLIGLTVQNSYLAIGISFLTAVVFFLSRQLLQTLARLKIVNPSLAPWLLLLLWGLACAIIAYRTLVPRK